MTLARFRKHVSPLTGVVSRLERMDADLALNASYVASHNFSPWPDSVDELRAGLSGDSYGKGSTAEQAEASALMEAIERYSGVFQGDEIRVTRRFTDFAPGQAIVPNDVMLFSDAQYRQDQAAMAAEEDASPPPAPFDPSALIEWSPAWSLRDGCFSICRRAFSTTSTTVLAPTRRAPIPTAARPATPSRKRSCRDFWSWSSATRMRSGGTIECGGRNWTSTR